LTSDDFTHMNSILCCNNDQRGTEILQRTELGGVGLWQACTVRDDHENKEEVQGKCVRTYQNEQKQLNFH